MRRVQATKARGKGPFSTKTQGVLMDARSLSRRRFLQGVAGVGAAAALTACVPAPSPDTAAGSDTADAAVVEVLMFDRNVVQDLEYRKELAERFNASQGGIRVTVDVIPQGYDQTIMARIAGGTAGDAFRHASHFGMSKFTTRGLLQALDEYVALDDYDLSVFIEGPLSSNRVNGKLYALPVNGHAGHAGLYFAPEIFGEAGVELPTADWTYDDFKDAAATLTRDTDGDGKSDSWGTWFGAWYQANLTLISAHDGWPLNEDGTQATWGEPGAIAGMQWIQDMYHVVQALPVMADSAAKQQLWSSGKLASALSGVWEGAYLGDITPENLTFSLVPGPKGPTGKRGGFAGCNNFPIWSSSEQPYETFQWIKYLSSQEVGVEGIGRIGEPGLRYDVFEHPDVANDPLIIPHFQVLQHVKPFPAPHNGRDSEVIEATKPLLEGMYVNELSAEEGCQRLQEAIQAILDMPPVEAA